MLNSVGSVNGIHANINTIVGRQLSETGLPVNKYIYCLL